MCFTLGVNLFWHVVLLQVFSCNNISNDTYQSLSWECGKWPYNKQSQYLTHIYVFRVVKTEKRWLSIIYHYFIIILRPPLRILGFLFVPNKVTFPNISTTYTIPISNIIFVDSVLLLCPTLFNLLVTHVSHIC